MKLRSFYVYIMTNAYNRVLYIGVTSDLVYRIDQHKQSIVKGFTKQYNVNKLIYYEIHDTAEAAINREKQLKRWHREWKLNLVREQNPEFHDLALDL